MTQGIRFGLVALAAIALAACGSSSNDDMGPSTDDMEVGDTGEIRVWHLAEDAGAVDVFIDGAATLEGFEFEQNTDFIELPAGSYDVAVAPAGAGIEAAVITVDGFALGAGERWTIIAAQLDSDAAADGAFAALPVEETSSPGDGEIAFRVFHAAYAVPAAVNVHNASDPNLPVIAGDLAQGTVNASAIVVPSAAYSLGLDVDDDEIVDLVTAGPIDQPAGSARILAGAISKAGEEPGEVETEIVFLVNAGENIHDEVELEEAELGELRFWHLAEDAGQVDIFLNGTAVAENVSFEGNTAFAPFLAGSFDVAIAPAGAGAGSAVIEVSNFPLGEGESYTLIAAQLLEDGTAAGAFAALPILEDRSAPTQGVFYNVFHAAYAVPSAVNVHNVDGAQNPLRLENIAQGTAAATILDVPNVGYTFGLDVDRDGAIDFQTESEVGPFAGAVQSVTLGAISKAGEEPGEVETEIVFLPGDGEMIHDEVELGPFGG